jgi:DNA-directed RNA polymerase subunit RPC12/RpoP
MALVNAKCTACGANLEVDGDQDAAVCKYCSTAFIVEKAINNFKISKAQTKDGAEDINVYGITQTEQIEQDKGSYEKIRDEYITRICNRLCIERKSRGDEYDFYNEVLEIIKISLHDYDRRCSEYWGMFYKAVFVIAFLLSLPYFMLTKPELNEYSYMVIIFPILSFAISVFAFYALPRIHDKNLKYNLHSRALRTYLSTAFVESDMPILTKKSEKYKNSLKNFRITRTTMFLFGLLIILSLVELLILLFNIIIF